MDHGWGRWTRSGGCRRAPYGCATSSPASVSAIASESVARSADGGGGGAGAPRDRLRPLSDCRPGQGVLMGPHAHASPENIVGATLLLGWAVVMWTAVLALMVADRHG